MKDGTKILVPHDGSEYADRAMREAVDIARKFSSSITVLHVYHDPYAEEAELRNLPSLRFLDDVEEGLKKAGVQYDIRIEHTKLRFIEDSPPAVILRISEEEGYELLTMGGRGLGGKDWLLGSVASKVVSEAKCNIFLAK